jgi:hypothetical protein
MKEPGVLRVEIARLRSLAAATTDPQALAAVNDLVRELELRLHRGGNGAAG